MNLKYQVGFHDYNQAVSNIYGFTWWYPDTEFTYKFTNFFHPYVGELIQRLNQKSLEGLLDPQYQQSLSKPFFDNFYTRLNNNVVDVEAFNKEIDVSDGGPYANYNWELFFHFPLTIAVHLSKNQRFAEAQRWFHYIFDPTSDETSIPAPQRYWKFLAFYQGGDVTQISELLALLSKPAAECTSTELELKDKILAGYEGIKNYPFQPHRVARTRHLAYQYNVVMKYLDNLIAWGDSLFAQDTIETINEATQLYVLAANLLGPRPQPIPPAGTVKPKNFAQLKAQKLDPMGNAMVELEGMFPFNLSLPQTQNNTNQDQKGPLFGIGRTLYFCIPRNDKLLSYWDTVADRLFKIRHCLNIEGLFRQLALFDPPIDPGMLVKAAAAGIDISSIVNGLNQPVGPLRALPLIQKALELASEVRGLGGALLSAIEKGDGEHLSLLRQSHEINIQKMTQDVRFLQWKQAQEATQALLRTRASALERLKYYARLLGIPPDPNAPETLPLSGAELTEENFDQVYSSLVEQYDRALATQAYPPLAKPKDSSPAAQSGAAGIGKLFLNLAEDLDLNVKSPEGRDDRLHAQNVDSITAILALIPDMGLDLHFWGLGGHANIFGGSTLAAAGRFASSIFNTNAAVADSAGQSANKSGSFQRRGDDWFFQYNLAARELMQNGRQIISSLIAEQVAHHEYQVVQAQIAQAQEVDTFLHEKFSNEELYGWMQGEISRIYYEYYRFAFDTARKAERTMKLELMRPELDSTDFVQFNYWDGGRRGLLSGEALQLDIKRLEMAYHDNNKREFELTRHISMRQLDPLALLNLRVTGKCDFTIPEWLYDRDCPGHYLRRIKSVGISLPAVVGPYTSLNCTLTLLRSTIRKSPLLSGSDYARQGVNDDRFIDYSGAVQSIVTSGGNNDSGMFETSLSDQRFLPFEGAGAVGSWHLELPNNLRAFDYGSISDVILHVRYTARQGGQALGDQAIKELQDQLNTAGSSELALLFSLSQDFPTEWSAFANSANDLALRMRKDYFPYMVQSETLSVDALDLFAPVGNKLVHRAVAVPAGLSDDLNGANGYSDLTISPDSQVLKRDAGLVYLVLRYSFGS